MSRPCSLPERVRTGGGARARRQGTCCAARALPERVRMGEQRAPESPIQGISTNRTNIVKSRDTTQRFLPFHPASVIARGSRSTRAALAHTPASAARLGGGEGGRVLATALGFVLALSRSSPQSRCCYYSALYSAIGGLRQKTTAHSRWFATEITTAHSTRWFATERNTTRSKAHL